MRKKYVFISGPYTQGDVALNVAEATRAGDLIRSAGHVPYIPHLSHFWHLLCPHDWNYWLELGFDWLESCDVMIRLEGPSVGAEKETAYAKELNIPVYRSVSEFLQAQAKEEECPTTR